MSLSKLQPDFPHLCSLAIFSQMSLLDRISAHQVCPEWYHRVREVNQTTVKPLTIAATKGTYTTVGVNFTELINDNKNILRSARLLTNSDGSPQFLVNRLTRWNSFQLSDNDQQNLITLKQIASTFSSISELIFINVYCEKLKLLTVMLQNDHWRRQLVSLNVICRGQPHYNEPTILQPLFTAINSLSALKYLTLKGVSLYDLSILAQLKKINCDYENSLLNSLQESAAQNTGELSVEVSTFDLFGSYITELSELSDQLRGSITCLNIHSLHIDNFLSRGTSFPNLTTLFLCVSSSTLSQRFPALSQLHQLQQLSLSINFTDLDIKHRFPPSRAQLLSVKVLDLRLSLNFHSQLNWLNLHETMPNLQAIHLYIIYCRSCGIKSHQDNLPANIVKRNCFRDILQSLHYNTCIPLNRLSYYYNKNVYTLSEEFL